MSSVPLLAAAAARQAIRALLPLVADLVEAAAVESGAHDVVTRTDELAVLLREAAVLADAIGLIHRRSGR